MSVIGYRRRSGIIRKTAVIQVFSARKFQEKHCITPVCVTMNSFSMPETWFGQRVMREFGHPDGLSSFCRLTSAVQRFELRNRLTYDEFELEKRAWLAPRSGP
jgi:hypothetical protein